MQITSNGLTLEIWKFYFWDFLCPDCISASKFTAIIKENWNIMKFSLSWQVCIFLAFFMTNMIWKLIWLLTFIWPTAYLKITISVLCFSDSNEIYSWGNGNSGQYVLAVFSLITLLYFHFVSDWLLRNRNTQVHYTEHTVYHLILHSNFDLMLFNEHKQSFCILKCFKLTVCSIIVFWIFANWFMVLLVGEDTWFCMFSYGLCNINVTF